MAETILTESKEEKKERVGNLKWLVDRNLTTEDHWVIGFLVTVEFLVFLFLNEQKEVAGPKDQYPMFYYIAVIIIFMFFLTIVMALHSKGWGDRRKRLQDGITDQVNEVEEINTDDAEYLEIIGGI